MNIKLERSKTRFINIFIIQFIILSVINIAFVGRTHQDGPIMSLNSTVNHKKLRFIKTTKKRSDQIENLVSLYEENSKIGKTIFFGYGSHLYKYLVNEENYWDQSYRMNTNKDIEKLINFISNNDIDMIIYVYDYPDRAYKATFQKEKFMKAIEDEGFLKVEEINNCAIFKKNHSVRLEY